MCSVTCRSSVHVFWGHLAAKIVQVSAGQKKTPQDLLLLCRTQPILCKDSKIYRIREKEAGC